MAFCGECGARFASDAVRFCPACGSPAGAARAGAEALPGAEPGFARRAPGDVQAAPAGSRARRRWVLLAGGVGAAVVLLGVGGAFALRMAGGADEVAGAWMWQQSIDASQSNYGMALRKGDDFVQGPPVGVGDPAYFLRADGRMVAMPEFAGGFASLVHRSSDDDDTVTLTIASDEDAQVVSEWAGDLRYLNYGSADYAKAFIDDAASAIFFTIDKSDVATCYRVDAESLKPVQVASSSDCRWDGDRAVAVTQREGAAPRFVVYDRDGARLSEGQFPPGEYGSASWLSAEGWIWATRTTSSDDGAQESSAIEVMDLVTGQPVVAKEGLDTTILATAAGGRGLVVGIDSHEEKWEVLLLDRDGGASAPVEAPHYASALIADDGARAWIGTHGDGEATVHSVAAGTAPSQIYQASNLRMLTGDSGDVLLSSWGADTSSYDVVRVDTAGADEVVLSGQEGSGDSTAGARVYATQFAGRQFVLGPDGSAGTIWELTTGEPAELVPDVDVPEEEGETRSPQLMSGPEGELLVLYSQAGQDKLDAVLATEVTALTQGPSIQPFGIDAGRAWYSSMSEGQPTASYSVGLDGEDLPTQTNLVLAATPVAVKSDWITGHGPGESYEPWQDPIKADCQSSGYRILAVGDTYSSAATDVYVCADLDRGDRVEVTPADPSASTYIGATSESAGYSDTLEGTRWTAPAAGFYRINAYTSCWYCSPGEMKIEIKGTGA